ncbi:MAG TPA: gamma-glutamyl-phosphate reductase, partial [Demequina sp.]|nr:gamma-glutamyl-phosphate reductase [Demequina sp.]
MTDTEISADVEAAVLEACRRAKVASRVLANATRLTKDAALNAMADALVADAARIVAANAKDVNREREGGMSPGLLDRLTLTEERIGKIAEALRFLASLPDPVGEIKRGSTLPNGLRLIQKAV